MDFINIGDNNFCGFRFTHKHKLYQHEKCLFPLQLANTFAVCR